MLTCDICWPLRALPRSELLADATLLKLLVRLVERDDRCELGADEPAGDDDCMGMLA